MSVNQNQRITSRRPAWLPPSKSATGGSNKPQQAAFTLVEIMIVVSLIVLLAMIAIPNFLKTRATAWQGACVSNLRHIDDAIQQWAMENGKSGSANVGFTDISSYLRRSVICPAGGQTFDDSYLLTIVEENATCRQAPASHILPTTSFEVVSVPSTPTAPGGQSGSSNPPLSSGSGGNSAGRPAPPGHSGSNGQGNPTPPGHGSNGGNGHKGP
jgi:prepilin-type N-terminal cleavage/methylation domain-containing protein